MTEGFEVLVHEVIEAITTAPWSISTAVPSAMVNGVGALTRPCAPLAAETWAGAATGLLPMWPWAGASLAGNESAEASSTQERTPKGLSCCGTPGSRSSPPVSPLLT